jgi:hypothetical protein
MTISIPNPEKPIYFFVLPFFGITDTGSFGGIVLEGKLSFLIGYPHWGQADANSEN